MFSQRYLWTFYDLEFCLPTPTATSLPIVPYCVCWERDRRMYLHSFYKVNTTLPPISSVSLWNVYCSYPSDHFIKLKLVSFSSVILLCFAFTSFTSSVYRLPAFLGWLVVLVKLKLTSVSLYLSHSVSLNSLLLQQLKYICPRTHT